MVHYMLSETLHELWWNCPKNNSKTSDTYQIDAREFVKPLQLAVQAEPAQRSGHCARGERARGLQRKREICKKTTDKFEGY